MQAALRERKPTAVFISEASAMPPQSGLRRRFRIVIRSAFMHVRRLRRMRCREIRIWNPICFRLNMNRTVRKKARSFCPCICRRMSQDRFRSWYGFTAADSKTEMRMRRTTTMNIWYPNRMSFLSESITGLEFSALRWMNTEIPDIRVFWMRLKACAG